MKKFWLMSYGTIFLVLMLCVSPIQAKDKRSPHISHAEFNEVIKNGNERYVYLGKQFSDLYEVISQINTLENKPNSITRELQQHIEDGFSIGLYDSVVEALNYAENALRKNAAKITPEEVQDITHSLEIVVDQVVNGMLTIDPEERIDNNSNNNDVEDKHCWSTFSYRVDSSDSDRNCEIIIEDNRMILPCPVKVKHGIKVFGKAKFKDDVIFKDK